MNDNYVLPKDLNEALKNLENSITYLLLDSFKLEIIVSSRFFKASLRSFGSKYLVFIRIL